MPELVLVTGASGIVGRALVARLRERGLRVRCLARGRAPEGADEIVRGDLGDAGSLRHAIDGAGAVVHLAARTHARRRREYERTNVEGTRNLVEACAGREVERFVLASSRAIGPEGGAYSRSKLAAEQVVRDSGVPHVVVRLAEVYGGGGEEGLDRIVGRAAAGATVALVGPGSDEVCPVFIDDAVDALAAAVTAPAAVDRTYTVAGPCMTVREAAERSIRHFGSRSRVRRVPTTLVSALGHAGRVMPLPIYPDQLARLRAPKEHASPELARDLGVEPRPLEEGLAAAGASS